MKTIDKVSALISRMGAIGAGLILGAMTALILYEILLRAFLGQSTLVAEELVGFGLGAFMFLGMGYSLQHGSFIRLNLFLSPLSKNLRRVTLAAGMVVTLTVTAFLFYAFWTSMTQKFSGGTLSAGYSQIPLWIPEAIVLVGLAIFTLQVVTEGLRLLLGQAKELETLESSEIDLDKEVLL